MKTSTLPPGFGAIWGAVAVDAIGFGIVIPILPRYASDFGASPAVIGVILASFSLAQFVASPRWGRLSDRIGRRPALVASLVGTAGGALVTAAAPGLALVLVGRIIDGASGGSLAIAQASTADLAAPTDRTRLLGLLGAAFGLGFVAGPAIGGIAALAGPRVPFLVAGVLAAANTIWVLRRFNEPRRAVATPQHDATGSPPPTHGPAGLVVAAFLATAAFAVFEVTFPLLGARRLGLSVSATSFVFVAAGLLVAAANAWLVSPAANRLGDLGALRVGLLVGGAGLTIIAGARSLSSMVAGVAVLSLGHGLVLPALTSAVVARIDAASRGGALGVQQGAATLARVAGPLVGGAVFGLAGPTDAYLVAALVAAAALASTFAVATRTAPSPPRVLTSSRRRL